MRLVKVNVKDIPKIKAKRPYSNNYKLLMTFHDSDDVCAEVKDYTQKNVKVCHTSLLASVRRYHLNNIRVVKRDDRIFLVKDNI